jgi:RNA polymerase sigma-70 factor (ECF subfamily)
LRQIFKKHLPELVAFGQKEFDELSFEIFFKENYSLLCWYCQSKFEFDIDEANEAVQSAFLKLWETRTTLSPDLNVKAYIFTIVTNICNNIIRHNKVKQKHESYLLDNSTFTYTKEQFDDAELSELKAKIDQAIAELPDQMRTIFKMSRFDDLKYVEISTRLYISVKTVETQMGRALIKLRQKLSIYLTICPGIILLVSLD